MPAREGAPEDERSADAPDGAQGAGQSDDDEIEILEVVGLEERTPRERAPSRPASGETASGEAAPAGDAAEAALLEARRASERYEDLWRRALADLDNFRKRTERDSNERRTADAAELVRRLLPVIDDLELALRSEGKRDDPLRRGVALTLQQLLDVLGREGLQPMTVEGTPFDPHHHEAAGVVTRPDLPAGTVVEEMRRGYLFRERLLRPALVQVAAGATGGGAEERGANAVDEDV